MTNFEHARLRFKIKSRQRTSLRFKSLRNSSLNDWNHISLNRNHMILLKYIFLMLYLFGKQNLSIIIKRLIII